MSYYDFIVLAGSAIQLELLGTYEQIFQASKEEMATQGEWQLVGIKSERVVIPTLEGYSYDELRFFVRTCTNNLWLFGNYLQTSCEIQEHLQKSLHFSLIERNFPPPSESNFKMNIL